MSRVLVDSNVLIDILTADERWLAGSEETLADVMSSGIACINPLIYAKLCRDFDSKEALASAIEPLQLKRLALPYEAAFPASQAFVSFRKRGGTKSSPLPDFFIGAHAQVERMPLLTRDVQRFRTYFPDVELIAPLETE